LFARKLRFFDVCLVADAIITTSYTLMIGRSLRQYQITERLGEGGMGVVWKARDTALDRDVALKVLPPDEFTRTLRRERFTREAKAASILNHPNIVTIYEINSVDDVDFIAMEYVRGETLAAVLARERLSIERTLDYARQLADAVGRAHAAGIVHRDLKPPNIMITPEGLLKVLDFGLAKVTETSQMSAAQVTQLPLTREGARVGTTGYMSPEQALGGAVDARSDVFSFGVILYEMLSGRRPFIASSEIDSLHKLYFSEPPPVESLRADTPRALAALVKRAIAKNPADRYENLLAVADELRQVQRGLVHGAAQGGRSWRRWAIPVAAAVLATTLGASALYLWRQRPFAVAGAPITSSVAESIDPYALTHDAAALLIRQDREGNVDRAIALLERAIAQDKQYALAYAHLSDAYLRRYQSNPDQQWLLQARDAAQQSVKINSDLAAGWQAMGFVHLQDRQAAHALTAFEKAADLDPVNPMPHVGLGLAYAAEKRDSDAEAALRRAIELGPSEWRTHGEFGQFYFRRARYADAIEHWEHSRALAPDNVLTLRNLGAAYYLAGRPDDAGSVLQRALEVRPSGSIYTNLGTIRFFQGRYADAVAAFEKAVEFGANNHQFWGNLGDGYRWAPGRRAEAPAAYRRAIELIQQQAAAKPEDADLRTRHALYLAKLGNTSAALTEIDKLTARNALTAQMHYRVCVIYELAGDRGQALAALHEALKSGYPAAELPKEPELINLRSDARYHRLLDSFANAGK
jgi:eukaryotic-like serine/threonine-protein kinase